MNEALKVYHFGSMNTYQIFHENTDLIELLILQNRCTDEIVLSIRNITM